MLLIGFASDSSCFTYKEACWLLYGSSPAQMKKYLFQFSESQKKLLIKTAINLLAVKLDDPDHRNVSFFVVCELIKACPEIIEKLMPLLLDNLDKVRPFVVDQILEHDSDRVEQFLDVVRVWDGVLGSSLLRVLKKYSPDDEILAELLDKETVKDGKAFAQLAGHLPREVHEIITFIQDAEKYARLGAYMPKGILLTGPPGTGKTTIARCVAQAAGAAFFSASGSEFVAIYVGQGPKNVRELFAKARAALKQGYEKVIIFVDEIDALGTRKKGGLGGTSEYNNTINEFLTQMDGFAQDPNIFIIGATNRPNHLDPALLRPGRFDRTIKIPLPNLENRIAILKFYIEKLPLVADEINYERLARSMRDFSGADIKNLVNEAVILAVNEDADKVGKKHFSAAVDIMTKRKRTQRKRR